MRVPAICHVESNSSEVSEVALSHKNNSSIADVESPLLTALPNKQHNNNGCRRAASAAVLSLGAIHWTIIQCRCRYTVHVYLFFKLKFTFTKCKWHLQPRTLSLKLVTVHVQCSFHTIAVKAWLLDVTIPAPQRHEPHAHFQLCTLVVLYL